MARNKNNTIKEVKLPDSIPKVIKVIEKFSKAAEDFNNRYEKARSIDESELHKQVTI